MKVASLFSGCGGLDLGLHKAGHEIILQCECDPGAQQVLRKAFPGVLLVPDICGLQRLPKETELVAAGFPCIDVSRAGLRAGLEGPSTGLVKHVFRLLATARDEQRPVPWVLLENVEALLDRAHGGDPAVSWVVQQLEHLGYNSWAHRVISSAGFGVPNRRRRVFILASLHGDARDVLLGQGLSRCMGACLSAVGGDCWECFDPDDPLEGEQQEGGSRAAAMLRCSYALDLGNARSAAGVDVVPTFTTSNARMCLLLSNGRFGLLRIEDAECLQGLPEGHTTPCYPVSWPGLRAHRVSAGAKDSDADSQARARFALLGNAVTVQVAEWIGQRLSEPYRYKYNMTDNDTPLPRTYQPPALPDRTWQELREVRIDQLRGEGAAGGVARLLRGAGVAAAPADESEEEEMADAAAIKAAAAGGEASEDSDVEMEVVLQSGDDEEGEEEATPDTSTPTAHTHSGRQHQQQGAAGGGAAAAGAAAASAAGSGAAAAAAQGVAAAAAVRERYGTGRLSTTWPRAAWFLAGQGRWGLKQASDTPVKSRFVPLGEFIKRVGPAPPDVALVTYLQRLKEQGWNVDRTERKMLMCGVNSIAEDKAASSAFAGLLDTALHTGTEAASSIGRLVWASLPLSNSSTNNGGHHTSSSKPPTAGPAAAAAAAGQDGTAGHSPAAAAAAAAASGRGVASVSAAPNISLLYWPCEAIDPFELPRGFKLLPEHLLALNPEERRLYLPPEDASKGRQGQDSTNSNNHQQQQQQQQHFEPHTPSTKASAASGLSKQAAGTSRAAAAAAAAAGGGSPAAGKGKAAAAAQQQQQQQQSGRKKLLLIWFHINGFEWRDEQELLPFHTHRLECKAAAQSLIDGGRLPRAHDWKASYREAKHCHTIIARAAKLRLKQQQLAGLAGPAAAALAAADLSSSDGEGGGSSDSEGECDHKAAVAGRAAKQALAVNMKMPRCKVCEACTQTTGSSSRRCLLVRATAAAAAGHVGAQLSVLGDKAVGADVEVWWPLDQAWYKGVISGYDKLRVRHTVEYADGDVEIIPLWAPQQRIRLRNQPAQWVAKAAQLAADRAQRQRDMEAARAATRVAGAAGLADLPAASLTQLERDRRDNIERNRAMLQQLMTADTPAAAAAAAATSPAGGGGVKTSARASSPPAAAAAAADDDDATAAPAPAATKKRSRPPKPPRTKKADGSAAAAAADKGKKSSAAPPDAAAAAAAGSGVDVPAAAAGEVAVTLGKRTAACVAGVKIRDQMQALQQQVREPAGKKRKQTTAAAAAAAAAAGNGDQVQPSAAAAAAAASGVGADGVAAE